MAARFKQMKIPALVIDRNARVGDNWRKRYPTLTLHTVKRHHTCEFESSFSAEAELNYNYR